MDLRRAPCLVPFLARDRPGQLTDYPQQAPEEAGSTPAACGPPQHEVACPAGGPSSSAWTVSQRWAPSWPQKVALSCRTV
jgi:hypothetical protein